jgi:hypothetical protein
MTPQKFWMVWRAGSPTTECRHISYDEACTEAKRLSLKTPYAKFYILEATEYFAYNPVTQVTL